MMQYSPCIRNLKYAQALREQGHKVHLITTNANNRYGDLDNYYNSISVFSRLEMNPEIKDMLDNTKPDIIHYHNTPEITIYSIKYYNYPFIYDMHDLIKSNINFSKTHCKVNFIIISKKMAKISNIKNYIIIPNFYSGPILPHTPKKINKIIEIVYIGSFYFKESADVQIKEIKKLLLHNKNIKLHIYITESSLKPYVVSELKNNKQCIIHPSIKYDKIMAEFQKYHFGILFYHNNGSDNYCWPNKFSEYVSSGLPVLVDSRLNEVANNVNSLGIGKTYTDISKLGKYINNKNYKIYTQNIKKYKNMFHLNSFIPELINKYSQIKSNFRGEIMNIEELVNAMKSKGIDPKFMRKRKKAYLMKMFDRINKIEQIYQTYLKWENISAELNYWMENKNVPLDEISNRVQAHSISRPEDIGNK